MHACLYVRMHACMLHGACVHVCVHSCMLVCMHVCMHVSIYVHMHVFSVNFPSKISIGLHSFIIHDCNAELIRIRRQQDKTMNYASTHINTHTHDKFPALALLVSANRVRFNVVVDILVPLLMFCFHRVV